MTAREVKIDEVDMDPSTGSGIDLPDLDVDELFTTQPERWIDILIDAGLPEMAEELRQAIRKQAQGAT